MPIYFVSEQIANRAARKLQAENPERIARCEVYRHGREGWQIVIHPMPMDVDDLWPIAYSQLPNGRLAKKDPHALTWSLPKEESKAKPSAPGGPPSKGATARVWAIADEVTGDGAVDRGAIIDACVKAGINKSTAATQYSKWKKARGA